MIIDENTKQNPSSNWGFVFKRKYLSPKSTGGQMPRRIPSFTGIYVVLPKEVYPMTYLPSIKILFVLLIGISTPAPAETVIAERTLNLVLDKTRGWYVDSTILD